MAGFRVVEVYFRNAQVPAEAARIAIVAIGVRRTACDATGDGAVARRHGIVNVAAAVEVKILGFKHVV